MGKSGFHLSYPSFEFTDEDINNMYDSLITMRDVSHDLYKQDGEVEDLQSCLSLQRTVEKIRELATFLGVSLPDIDSQYNMD